MSALENGPSDITKLKSIKKKCPQSSHLKNVCSIVTDTVLSAGHVSTYKTLMQPYDRSAELGTLDRMYES